MCKSFDRKKGSFEVTTTRDYILSLKWLSIDIGIVLQNAKLHVQCKFYREYIHCRKDRFWKDILYTKTSCK